MVTARENDFRAFEIAADRGQRRMQPGHDHSGRQRGGRDQEQYRADPQIRAIDR